MLLGPPPPAQPRFPFPTPPTTASSRPQIPWLIAIAFWLSGGFIRSGLGARIAYSIVSLFGKTTLVRCLSVELACDHVKLVCEMACFC